MVYIFSYRLSNNVNVMKELITFREYLADHRQDFDAALFDVDGTLSYGGRALPGALWAEMWRRYAKEALFLRDLPALR